MGNVRYRKDRKRYQLDYVDADGSRRRPFCAAGTSKRQAERQLREIELQVRSGKAPSRHKPKFKAVASKWLKAGTAHWTPGTYRTYRQVLKLHLLPALGTRQIDLVDHGELQAYVSELTCAPNTQAKIRHVLHSVLEHAAAQGVIDTNPAARLKTARVPKGIPRWLTKEEYDSLLGACEGDARDAIILGVRTGLRVGELVALKGHDWKGRVLVVERAWNFKGRGISAPKGGKARSVPVHPEAAEVLARRPRSGWVFCNPAEMPFWMTGRFREAMKRAGLGKGGPHLLRHTFASWWVQEGGRLATLQQILGHATLRQVLTYAHLATTHVEAEAEQIWGPLGTEGRPRTSPEGPKRPRGGKVVRGDFGRKSS